MSGFERILVPTDFSEHAKEAVNAAVELAKRYNASIHIVHVFQSIAYLMPEGYISYSAPQLGDIMSALDNLLAAEKKGVANAGIARVEVDLLEGAPATEIVRYATDKRCDLVVMGTHGRTGIKHALLGSIAEKVVRTAPCAVMTVKAPKR